MRLSTLLLICCFLFIPIVSGAPIPWCGIQTSFFQHNESTTPAGYEELINYPSGNPQVDENVTINSGMGRVLIDSYITPENEPGVSLVKAGLRRYRTFHYVNSAAGITTVNFTVFKRSISGTESYLYSLTTDDINDLVANEYLTSYAVPLDLVLNTTDRLVIKVYGQTTHPSNIVLHWVYQGTTNTSHYESGYYVCDITSCCDPTGGLQSYTYPKSDSTPIIFWAVLAICSIAIFIMAFWNRIRTEKGEISKERIVFSLLGVLFNAISAVGSVVIDIPSDTGFQTMHTLYQGGMIPYIFVVMGLICFANLVYSLVQPEVVKPDTGEIRGSGEKRGFGRNRE